VGLRKDVRVYGHRGARARLPENTLPAFEYAIELGVDALEMDLAVTKDDVIVISHDPILHGAVIRERTLAEVREWDVGIVKNPRFPLQKLLPGTHVPTLDDVLQLAGRGTFDYHLETKGFPDQPRYTPSPEEFARMVLERIQRYQLEERVALLSFDFRTLVAMRKLAPEIRLSALTESDPRDFATIAKEAGDAEIISPELSLVTPDKVTAAKAAGLDVVAWTANTPRDWDKLVQAKVDAIVTDDPAALIAYLNKVDAST
jgi:glycerophosphoryl diester phosphodiesterase